MISEAVSGSSFKPDVASVTLQGSLVELRQKRYYEGERPRSGGGIRGEVTDFSAASRRRMMEMFARLDQQAIGGRCSVKFITLTYGRRWPSLDEAKDHLYAFEKRIRRRYRRAATIWRMELQERGAPHFHLVVFNLPWVSADLLRDMWAECIGWDEAVESSRRPRVEIKPISSWRRMTGYVSKYMAKGSGAGELGEVPPPPGGGDPSSPGSDDDDGGEGPLSLSESHSSPRSGRWWGRINAKHLPMAEKRGLIGPVERYLWRIRRVIRRLCPVRVNRTKDAGQVMPRVRYFTRNPEKMMQLINYYYSLDFAF